jgi:hypothetical protein
VKDAQAAGTRGGNFLPVQSVCPNTQVLSPPRGYLCTTVLTGKPLRKPLSGGPWTLTGSSLVPVAQRRRVHQFLVYGERASALVRIFGRLAREPCQEAVINRYHAPLALKYCFQIPVVTIPTALALLEREGMFRFDSTEGANREAAACVSLKVFDVGSGAEARFLERLHWAVQYLQRMSSSRSVSAS